MSRAIQAALLLGVLLAGCSGPGHVEFREGECIIDGSTATLAEVEARQARITERMLGRQPLLVLVTVLVVALAAMSHVEKLVLLFSTRGAQTRGLSERLRLAIDRYRRFPIRYFAIVTSTLALLVLVGAIYVYLDADKRASERALGLLQFCHIALRNQQQQAVLSEQRNNLEAIQATTGSIRALVDGLPPEEQRKAHEIVEQLNTALSRQGRIVSESLGRTDAETRAVRENTEALGRNLSTVEAGVVSLKSLPATVHDVSDHVRELDGSVRGLDAHVGALNPRLTAIEAQLKALSDRPAPACPACVCSPVRDAPPEAARASVDGGAPFEKAAAVKAPSPSSPATTPVPAPKIPASK